MTEEHIKTLYTSHASTRGLAVAVTRKFTGIWQARR